MSKILITGWLGYIWSHAAVVFAAKWYDIVIIDDLSNTNISVLEKLTTLIGKQPKFYPIDLKNNEEVRKVFQENTIDGVIHFAAFKAVGESCEDPFKYYENNIGGGVSLYKTMNEFGVKNIVFSSSCTVYDTMNVPPPYDEQTPKKTINPYGSTKRISEIILEDLSTHKWFNTILLRYFNPIGAHESGLIGENPKGIPNNLLPYIYKVARWEYECLNIRGDDYPTPDGTCIRDYLHVMDLAQAHVSAYEYLQKKNKSEWYLDIFNLWTGQGTSVFEMIKLTEQAIGKEIKYKVWPRRAGDTPTVYANTTKANTLLGRTSKKTISEAIQDGWKFIEKIQS